MRHRAPEFFVLAMDIGSSSARSAVFDKNGRPVPGTEARRQYALEYSADGAAELSPHTLRPAVEASLRKSLREARSRKPIIAVAACSFWHGLLGLDGKGRPLTPIFTWADSRCAPDAARLREELDERLIHGQTGCMLRASFWPAKLRWLRRTNRRLFQKVHRWVSPADWIFKEIFGVAGTSHSMASATGLYDLRSRTWHAEMCEACEISPRALDELTDHPTGAPSGFSEIKEARIFQAIGDGAAGNLGCGAEARGRVAINVGTSAAVRIMESGLEHRPVPFGLFRYVVDRQRTVIGGAVSNAGNLHQWCLRELRVDEIEPQAMRRSFAANDGLAVLPFWVNERAPTWPENLGGAIVGLTQSTEAAEILRATACAGYYRLADILERLEKSVGRAEKVIVSGGIVHSKASLRLLADALGRDILVSVQAEASLRGAVIFALEKLGCDPPPAPRTKLIRHNPVLTQRHHIRRQRQASLENRLSNTGVAD
jgi:gluconokinase